MTSSGFGGVGGLEDLAEKKRKAKAEEAARATQVVRRREMKMTAVAAGDRRARNWSVDVEESSVLKGRRAVDWLG